jgi:hypothetical protein
MNTDSAILEHHQKMFAPGFKVLQPLSVNAVHIKFGSTFCGINSFTNELACLLFQQYQCRSFHVKENANDVLEREEGRLRMRLRKRIKMFALNLHLNLTQISTLLAQFFYPALL